MKYLVETNGDFALCDMGANQVIQAFRPTVVEDSPFIQNMRGFRLTILTELADEASDTALAEARDEDELAVAIAALPTLEVKPKPPATKQKAGAKE